MRLPEARKEKPKDKGSGLLVNQFEQLNEIHAGSSILLNEDVDQLVSAMSLYDVPSSEGNVIAQDVMDILQPIFTEVWL